MIANHEQREYQKQREYSKDPPRACKEKRIFSTYDVFIILVLHGNEYLISKREELAPRKTNFIKRIFFVSRSYLTEQHRTRRDITLNRAGNFIKQKY